LHWRTTIGGKEKSFDAEITEQIPGKRIAGRSVSGAPNAGAVTFHSLNPEMTRIMLQMEYEPDGLVENAGVLLGVASHRIYGDLERSKELSSPEDQRPEHGDGRWTMKAEIRRY